MDRAIPVGLTIPTLLFPLCLFCGSMLIQWAGSTLPAVAPATTVAGWFGMLIGFVSAWVIGPVGVYSIVANSVLRTAGQLLAVLSALLIMAFPVLAFLAAGI